jgi:hypothetical protein
MATKQKSKRQTSTGRQVAKGAPLALSSKSSTLRVVRRFWTPLSSRLKFLIGSLGLSGAGVLAFFTPILEPAREWLLRKLWVEQAVITASCDPCTLSAGQSTSISIDVQPNGMSGVSKGIIKLEFDEQALVLASESSRALALEATRSPINLEKAFVLYGMQSLPTATKTRIRATLQTQYIHQKSEWIEVSISPKTTHGARPFIDPNGKRGVNLSGDWKIEMGGTLGGMKISQDEHSDVIGSYWLEHPKGKISGQIEGYKDGTSFKVFFIRNNSASRWRVDANFAINQADKGFLEMHGCAFSIRPDATVLTDTIAKDAKTCVVRNYFGWRGDASSTFYASAQLTH